MLAGVFMFSVSAKTFEVEEEEPIVARMHISHFPRNHDGFQGHSWIYIENLTNKTLEIGAGYKLAKGKGVSIGSYGTSVPKPGVYYNVEAWRYQKGGEYITVSRSLSKELTQSDLNAVNKAIKSCNHWSYLFNCGYTAIKIWNSVPGEHLIYLFAPFLTQMQILASKNDTTGFPMTIPKWQTECFFQVKDGNNVYLEPADPRY